MLLSDLRTLYHIIAEIEYYSLLKFRKRVHIMKKTIAKNNPKKYRTIEDDLFFIGTIFAMLLLAAAIAGFLWPGLRHFLTLPPCLFHQLCGYYCPGCGGTRAFRALLHGHILTAFCFHPFVPYAVAVYLSFMATQATERISRSKLPVGMRYHNGLVWLAVILIMGNFIVKNLLHYFYGFTM